MVRKRNLIVPAVGVLTLVALLLWPMSSDVFGLVPTASAATGHGPYSTNFAGTENPLSESGNWINGGSSGLDWTNCRKTPGQAFGTMDGNLAAPQQFADSTCVLSGAWGPNQTAQATVRVVASDSTQFEEVEVRLRTTITGHSITGYEINCSVKPGNPYMQIVRWNGSLGSWTQLDGRGVGCVNGDVLKGTISGSTISAYKNDVLIFSATDSVYTGGSPGIGFFIQNGGASTNANFGISSFYATDGLASQAPSPPTNLLTTVK